MQGINWLRESRGKHFSGQSVASETGARVETFLRTKRCRFLIQRDGALRRHSPIIFTLRVDSHWERLSPRLEERVLLDTSRRLLSQRRLLQPSAERFVC